MDSDEDACDGVGVGGDRGGGGGVCVLERVVRSCHGGVCWNGNK